MNWFRCRRHRQAVSLLAAGVLPDADQSNIRNHLAQCVDCRTHFEQIKAVTAPLANWEEHFAQIGASDWNAGDPARRRLGVRRSSGALNAVVLSPARDRNSKFNNQNFLFECWRQLILPCRHVWTGLAAAWLLLLLANLSLRVHSPVNIAGPSPTPEMIASFQEQKHLLAELIGQSEYRDVLPPKPGLPRPQSERRVQILAA